jgi:uncharacterized protein YcfL
MRKFTVVVISVFFMAACAAAQMANTRFDIPRNEMYIGYAFEQSQTSGISKLSGGDVDVDSTSLNGVAFEYAHYMQDHLGFILDLAHESNSKVDSTGIKLTHSSYMAGPAYRVHHWGFFSASVHGMGGVEHSVFTSPQSGQGNFSIVYDSWSGAAAVGATVDGNLSPHVGVRLAQVDYVYTHHYSSNQNTFRYSGGVVFRF